MAKTALCIGINDYPGTQMDLEGCVNDANDWTQALGARGFQVHTLVNAEATLAAMRSAFHRVVEGAGAGDTVVITYSGHGTYVPDTSGDEVDGLDEALCPWDIRTAGAFVDDEIHEIFNARKAGVKLVLISDSCHSGTVTRAVAHDPDAVVTTRPRFLPIGNWMPDASLPRHGGGGPLSQLPLAGGTSPFRGALRSSAGDLLLSGCKEGPNNFSYDATLNQRPNGAFTYYALKALAALPRGATYAQWHAAITPRFLPSASYPQSPQIVGSAAARQRVALA